MLLPALLLSLARAAGAPDAPTPAAGLDARSFGAVGDGLRDDGPALQRAINETKGSAARCCCRRVATW